MEAATDEPVRSPLRARTVLASMVAGTLLGTALALALATPRGPRFEARLPWVEALPGERDWPRAPLEGEDVRLESTREGRRLVVSAGSASEARSLARAFAAGVSPTAAVLAERRERVRAAWREAAEVQPPVQATSATGAAAALLARARWGRELAHALPHPLPATPPAGPPMPPAVEDAWLNVTWVADERDPVLLTRALVEATRADQRWFEDAGAWAGLPLTQRAEAWRLWQESRALLLEPLAVKLLGAADRVQRSLVERSAIRRLPAFDEQAGEPWAALAGAEARPARPLVLPMAAAWMPAVLVGAGGGSLAALFVLLFGVRLRPAAPRRRSLAIPGAADGAPVQVVTGRAPSLVVRALLELSAASLARGERVLLVDGSPRLRLHERLGREARWGLLECLAAEMPPLGLVHYGGFPGLHLLAFGDPSRTPEWSRLGRTLDELLPHFGRIVLAVEPGASPELGFGLAGREVDGWWASRGHDVPLGAGEVMARLSMALQPLEISEGMEATLEALAERVERLRPAVVPAAARPEPVQEQALPVPAGPPPHEPVVLDCDLQVLQRLRFLAWMRRLQAEERSGGARVST
jgi:hypothetical protein